MKRSNLTFIAALTTAALLGFSGCARNESVLWHSFQQTQTSRKPAQADANTRPRCFIDRYNDQAIQSEIDTYQEQYAGGRKVDFTRDSLTWSQLPKSTVDVLNQKMYLNVTGRTSWFTVDARQQNCKDLTCFASSLYSAPTNEGLMHQWYFLKTGYAMAGTDAYPWVTDTGTEQVISVSGEPVEHYLFNHDEWKSLWLQANLLPKSMLHLPDLQSIHRLPHGYIPPSWQTSGVCAWAYGSWRDGIILISDECLTQKTNRFDTTAFFFAATTHEMGHRLASWNAGRRNYAFSGLDEDPNWLALSGWVKDELVNANGTTSRQWRHSSDNSGWLSDYAKSSPHEDWAESVGHYRTDPKATLLRAPAKYAYLKAGVFEGKGYSANDLKVTYAGQIKDALVSDVSDWVAACLTSTPPVATLTNDQQAIAAQVAIDLPLEPSVLSCLKEQFTVKLTQVLSDLRYSEPEGCATLDAPGVQTDIISQALPDTIAGVVSFLQTDHRIADLIAGVQNFRSSISGEFDGKSVFLSCYGQADSEGCFKVKVNAEFDRLYDKYKVQLSAGSDAVVALEKSRFARLNNFADTQLQVTAFFTGIFSTFSPEVDTSSQKVWQSCGDVAPDLSVTDAPTEPYSAGAHYLSASMLKCLNVGAIAVEADIRGKAAIEQGIEVFTDDAKNWINTNVIFPRIRAVFESDLTAAEAGELVNIRAAQAASITASVADITSDLSWETIVGTYSLPNCRVIAAKKLAIHLQADQYRYTAMDPYLTSLSDTVCEQVRIAVHANYTRTGTAATVDTGVVSIAQMAALDPIWSALKSDVKIQMQSRYAVCKSNRYPGSARKRFCLFSEVVTDDVDHHNRTGWYWALHRALITWFNEPGTEALLAQKGWPDSLARKIALKRLDDERQEISADITADFAE